MLAYAEHDNEKDNHGRGDNDRGRRHEDKHLPVVPEANAAWILAPFFGAVLLFSWRQLSRAKTQFVVIPISWLVEWV
jgi:hypothetical protein